MSRTTLPDGSVRYAPDRWHRGQRQSRASRLAVALTAVPVGVVGFVRLGPAVGVPLVVGTAVVTLLAVLVWRLTLPRAYTVTKSADAITLRCYGRTSTVQRNDALRGDARLVLLQYGLTETYVILSGDGGRIRINADMLPDEDLDDLVRGIPTGPNPPGAVTPRQLQEEFPGLLPVWTRRPYLFAFALVGALVVLVVAVLVTFALVGERDADDEREPTVQGLALSSAATSAQDGLQQEAVQLADPGPDWGTVEPYVTACDGGWQRVLSSGGTTPRPYTADDRAALTRLAREAGMVEADVVLEGDAVVRLAFEDRSSGATLELLVEDTYTGISTESPCVDAE